MKSISMTPIPDISAGLPEPQTDPVDIMAAKVREIANRRLRRDIESAELWEREIKEIETK